MTTIFFKGADQALQVNIQRRIVFFETDNNNGTVWLSTKPTFDSNVALSDQLTFSKSVATFSAHYLAIRNFMTADANEKTNIKTKKNSK